DVVLMLKMMQDDFNFLLVLDVDLQVVFRASFCMPPDHVLSNHDQRHEQNLNEVRQEQPEYKTHRSIKFQRVRCEEVPAEPAYGPSQDQQEEAHRADMRRDPDREAVKS